MRGLDAPSAATESRVRAEPGLFVGWADPGLDPREAQHTGAIPLGFSRTASGLSPTYDAAFGVSQTYAAGAA
jgi:hypothetical protein